jgi:hypothetical protein
MQSTNPPEQTNELANQLLAEKKVPDLIVLIGSFFLNNPKKEVKAILWDFYTTWVHSTVEVSTAKEHADRLMFYERLIEFVDELHELAEVIDNDETSPLQ